MTPHDCASVGCPNDATHRAHGYTGVALEVCASCLADMRAALDAGDCPGCGQRADCANGCQYPSPDDFHPINTERAS